VGFRINTAIGYGMPIGLFNFHFNPQTSNKEYSRADTLYDLINESPDVFKNIPDDQSILDDLKEHGYGYSLFGIIPFEDEIPKMFHYISINAPEYIIFMPSAYLAGKWYRWDDDIDYAVTRLSDDDLGTKVTMCQYGFYPFTNDVRSIETNRRIKWDSSMMARTDGTRPENIIPDVPLILRYWLRKLDIMAHDGINELRPMHAVWWD